MGINHTPYDADEAVSLRPYLEALGVQGVDAYWTEAGPIVGNHGEAFPEGLTCDWNDDLDEEENMIAAAKIVAAQFPAAGWDRITDSTEDPKLAYFERMLDARGIAHRRNGETCRAPIMEVDAARSEEAWAMLSEKVDVRGKMVEFDDIPDDDAMFE